MRAVVAAVFATVFDDAEPRFSGAQCVPEVLEAGGGHVGVAPDVVRFAEQFLAAKARGLHKYGLILGVFCGFYCWVFVGAVVGFAVGLFVWWGFFARLSSASLGYNAFYVCVIWAGKR